MGTDIIDSIAVCGEHLDEQWLSQDNTVIRGIFNQNAQVNIIGGPIVIPHNGKYWNCGQQ